MEFEAKLTGKDKYLKISIPKIISEIDELESGDIIVVEIKKIIKKGVFRYNEEGSG
ncbi:MAG: hypothetical protein ACRCZ0_11820 [Cetobacterium sp.]